MLLWCVWWVHRQCTTIVILIFLVKIAIWVIIVSTTHNAHLFVDACETGKGWNACNSLCHAEATFSCNAGKNPYGKTLAAYTDYLKAQLSLGVTCGVSVQHLDVYDTLASTYAVAKVRRAHTQDCNSAPSTNSQNEFNYSLILEFEREKIRHVSRISNEYRTPLYSNCKTMPLRPHWSGLKTAF
jgi:hypothetical protein